MSPLLFILSAGLLSAFHRNCILSSETAGRPFTDAAAGDSVGFPAVQTKQTPRSV